MFSGRFSHSGRSGRSSGGDPEGRSLSRGVSLRDVRGMYSGLPSGLKKALSSGKLVGGSKAEQQELQMVRLSDAQQVAVRSLRHGHELRLVGEDSSERCRMRVSVEMYALTWTRQGAARRRASATGWLSRLSRLSSWSSAFQPDEYIGVDQILEIGVMAPDGEMRSWTEPEAQIGALRKLIGEAGPTGRMKRRTSQRSSDRKSSLTASAGGVASCLLTCCSPAYRQRMRVQQLASAQRRGGFDERKWVRRRLWVRYRSQTGERRLYMDFSDTPALHTWLVGLDALVRFFRDVMECMSTRPSLMPWLRSIFIAATDRSSSAITIDEKNLPTLLTAANLSMRYCLPPHELAQAMAGDGVDRRRGAQHPTLSFVQAQHVFRKLVASRHITALFRKYAAPGAVTALVASNGRRLSVGVARMRLQEWLGFCEAEQGLATDASEREDGVAFDGASREAALASATAAYRRVAGSPDLGITQLQFQWLLLSGENSVLDPARLEADSAHEAPIAHYWVSTSHNTFLDGHQLNSHSTPDMYRRVLLEGCRSVEIDCWDGDDGEPEVTHGRTMCSRTKFHAVISALHDTAFLHNPRPVFLSLEMHLCKEQQIKASAIMRSVFGDELLLPEEVLAAPSPPSPAALRHRFLVKGKTAARAAEEPKKAPGPLENEHDSDDPEENAVGDDESRAAVKSEPEGPSESRVTLEESRTSVMESRASRSERHLFGEGGGGNLRSSTGERSKPAASPVIMRRRRARYVDPQLEAVTTVRSRPLEEFVNAGAEPPAWLLPITSISENKINELVGDDHHEQQHHSKHHSERTSGRHESTLAMQRAAQLRMARVYPKGLRTDSSNASPLSSWRAGVQQVALNMQTNDLPVQLARALFQRAGGLGYVPKPAGMLTNPPDWPSPRATVRCATLRLISLHQLPTKREGRPQLDEPHHKWVPKLSDAYEPPHQGSEVASPALTVEIHTIGGYACVTCDTRPSEAGGADRRSERVAKKEERGSNPASYGPGAKFKTAAVVGNGLNPIYDRTVHCLAAEPAESVLRVGVVDGDAEVAYEAVVLDLLRPGYRALQLRSSRHGTPIDNCFVFVHVALSNIPNPDPSRASASERTSAERTSVKGGSAPAPEPAPEQRATVAMRRLSGSMLPAPGAPAPATAPELRRDGSSLRSLEA